MKSRFIKSAVLLCACAAGATVFGGVARAQLQGWTIESVQLGGTATITGKRGSGGYDVGFNDTWGSGPLSNIALTPNQTWVTLRAETNDPGDAAEIADIKALTTGAKYLVRVKGPQGCAGQTHTLSFLLSSGTMARAGVTGPSTYWDWGQSETDLVEMPAPASRMAISASASGASSDVVATGPSSDGSDGDIKTAHSKYLVTRQVTFDGNREAEVEIPFALSVEGDYELPSGFASGSALGEASAGLSTDTRGVQISSDLESKYKFAQPYLAQNTADKKHYVGFLKRHYTPTAPELPLEFFIGGVARYTVSAKKPNGTDAFSDQKYKWALGGAPAGVYVPGDATEEERKELELAPSHPTKHLHLNFGSDWSTVQATNGSITTVAQAEVGGTEPDGTSVSATASVTVDWYSPKLLEIQNTEVPDWDPADQVIDDYILARQQVVEQGAGLTGGAYNMMYGVLPAMIMPDPTAGVLKGMKVAGTFLRAGRNSGKFSGLVGIFKGRIARFVDYDNIRGAQIVRHNAHPTQTAERVVGKLRERGVPKTHAASEFAGKGPQDEVADDLAALVNGRSKNIDEAGPLPGEGALTGPQKTVGGAQDFTNQAYRGAVRENEAAQTLSNTGYRVEQIPETTGSLDYRINGYEYDCAAPYFDPTYPGANQQQAISDMWSNLNSRKISQGKNRIVLNLDDFNAPTSDVLQHFRDNPIAGVDDMIVLKNNQVLPFWDFLR